MKKAFIFIFLTTCLLLTMANVAYASGTTNLLTNLVEGNDGNDLTKWNIVTTDGYTDHWTQYDSVSSSGSPPLSAFDDPANGGSGDDFYDFYHLSVPNLYKGELQQDIQLYDTNVLYSKINSDSIGLNASVYSYKAFAADEAEIEIQFFNGTTQLEAAGLYLGELSTTSAWSKVSINHVQVPQNTTIIRVIIRAICSSSGSYMDFDGIDVELCNLPDISITNPTANHTYNGTQSITISGTASDPDVLPVTISAAINGKTQSTTIASGATWNLSWDIASLGIADGDYTNIQVTADNGKGIKTATYTGTLTVDGTVPTASSLSPPDNAINVGVNDNLVINFSENVLVGTGNITIKKTSDDSTAETVGVTGGEVTGSGTSTITVDPAATLDGETGYYVVIDATAFSDTAGNSYAGISSSGAWNFTTADINAPTVSSVGVPSSGTYRAGQNLDFTVNYGEAVTVTTTGGTPYIQITLDTGGTVNAAYTSGSGTSALTFSYTVASGNEDTDGITVGSAITANGGTLQDAAGNSAALTLSGVGATTGVLVDAVAPTVSSVGVPSDGTYTAGQNLDFTVNYSEAVTVTTTGGTPYIQITLDTGGTVNAAYTSGSGTSALTFSYTVASGNEDTDGITAGSAITTNGGTLKDAAGNDAALTLSSIGSTTAVLVDGIVPTVSSVSVPSNGTYIAGQNLDFTVNYSEAVTVDTTGGTPYIDVTLDTGGTVHAGYAGGSGTSALTFIYAVASGNEDTNGITVGNAITADGGTLKDATGNDAELTLGVLDASGVKVDAIAPAVSSIDRNSPAGETTIETSVTYRVTFSEAVTGVDTGDFTLTKTGADGAIAAVSAGSGTTIDVTVSGITGDGTLRLDLNSTGTGITDAAGNAVAAGYTSGQTYTFDTTAPTVSSVGVPSSGTYRAGQNLDFTVNYGEAVTVDTTGGTPYIQITLDTGGTVNAAYTSGSGTSALTFSYTVASGNEDTDGITVGSAITANGGTLQDAAGNSAALTLSGVGATTGVLVDAVAPTVSSVGVPSDGTYTAGQNLDFTVNYSEAVTVNTTGGTPYIDITLGTGGTVHAGYASGSGTNALTFSYTVASGNEDTDGITVGSAITENGGTLKDAAGNDAALTLSSVGSTTAVLVDGIVPTVSSVSVPSNGTYTAGQNLDFTVNYSEAVTVNTTGGTPYIQITLDTGGTVNAAYTSGSGTSFLTFSYTVASGNEDADGIGVDTAITANGGTLKDFTGNDAALTLSSVGATNLVLVDAIAPTVSSIDRNSPASETTSSTSVTYRVTFSEDVTGVNTSDFTLTKTGTADGTIAAVSASSGTTIDVTVSGITGDGTLRLDLNSTGTGITDDAGNAIAAGYTSGQTYTFDTTAPADGSISINGGADYTNSTSVTLTLSATGASEMEVSESSSYTGASYETYAASKSFTLSSGDGIKTVYVKYKDAAGNETSTISDSITLDTTAPAAPTVTGATPASSNKPTWTWTTGGGGGNGTYRYKLDSSDLSSGAATTTNTSYTSAGALSEGNHTLYVQERDAAGNWSDSGSFTITIDTTAPCISGVTDNGIYNTDVTPTFTEGTAAITRNGGSPSVFTSGTAVTEEGSYIITLSDTTGNITSVRFIIDKTAPTGGSISINGGADSTNSTSVTLTLSATEASQMMVSEDSGFSGASYEAYSTGKSFTLSSGDGIKDVYVKYKDAAGNETSAISDTITLVTTAVTYTVTYNGNGSSAGSVPTDSTSYNSGDTVTVAGNSGGLTRTGYTFAGWNTAADGSGVNYTAGSGAFTISADTMLYAKWVLNTASAVADLSSLSVYPGTLSPGFSASETQYTVSVGNSEDSMTVTACVYDINATLNINGDTPSVTGAVYGEYAATIDLGVGSNPIYVTVTARDGATTKTYTITATRAAASHHSSGGNNSSSTATDNATTKVVINGEEHSAGTTTTTTEGGRTVTTITLDGDKIEALLEAKGNNTTVEIPISSTTDIAEGVLSGQTIKNMEAKEAVLVVKTDTISFTLPASEIDIDSVSEQLGQVALKDVAVHVTIATPPADTVKIVTDTADKNSYQIVVSPVEFEITCTNGDKTVEVSKFKAYVERTIAIPEGVDPSKITSGVVLNADGTFTHVPTQIIIIDGKYYAKINSLTNSTYTVIYNHKEFKDVESHWAKEVVNDMGSRLVISGIDQENFAPDRYITRAEFAATMIRALGLKAGSGASGFDDVKSSDWYNGYIKTAAEYGIISGYGNGSFSPADRITREQAMTMIARAMKITGLKAELAAGEEEKLLSGYEDGEVAAEYARSSIAKCIKTGVVSGKSSTEIAPKDSISRAEVAVMVKRFLQKSGLI